MYVIERCGGEEQTDRLNLVLQVFFSLKEKIIIICKKKKARKSYIEKKM